MSKDLSPGVKLLSSIFSGKALRVGHKEYYDLPHYFVDHRLKNDRSLPASENISSVYGEFLRAQVVADSLEGRYDGVGKAQVTALNKAEGSAKKLHYLPMLEELRVLIVRGIIADILTGEELSDYLADPIEQYITISDIGEFFSMMAKNRIWSDKTIQDSRPLAYLYKHTTDAKNRKSGVDDVSKQVVQDMADREPTTQLDFMDPRIYFTPEFEELEKRNRKRRTHEKYHKAIDAIDLTALKKNLIDPVSGQCFTPLGRQGEFLLQHKRFNFIAGSRRIGKTFLGAGYLSIRQLSLPGNIVIYVVPTKENHAKPAWREMQLYFSKFDNIRMVGGNKMSVYNDDMKSELHFISAERASAVRGNAANLLIFDEAAFIDERVYATSTPLVRTTKGMVYCISTVNPDTPKNYFYYNLVSAEISMHKEDSNMYGRRVDLFQNPFISDEDKKDIVEKESHLPSFDAERMANFAESSTFNMKNFWVFDGSPKEHRVLGKYPSERRSEVFDKDLSYYDRFVISYDGAKRYDKPGLIILGVSTKLITKKEEKEQVGKAFADIVSSMYIEAGDYYDQVYYVLEIAKMLKKETFKPVEVIIDYGGAGVAVEEIFTRTNSGVVPECIQAVGGLGVDRESYIRRVGKDLMVNKLKTYMELGWVRAFSFMNDLRLEFETYTDEKGKRAKGHHWDMISALYQVIWYIDRMGYLEEGGIVSGEEKHAYGELSGRHDNPEMALFKQPEPNDFGSMDAGGY